MRHTQCPLRLWKAISVSTPHTDSSFRSGWVLPRGARKAKAEETGSLSPRNLQRHPHTINVSLEAVGRSAGHSQHFCPRQCPLVFSHIPRHRTETPSLCSCQYQIMSVFEHYRSHRKTFHYSISHQDGCGNGQRELYLAQLEIHKEGRWLDFLGGEYCGAQIPDVTYLSL